MQIVRLHSDAILPTRATSGSAGYDLCSVEDLIVPARGKALIPTGLAMAIPSDVYARIAPRSGLTWKHSLDVGAGVIDSDYRNEVKVILFNHSDKDYQVQKGHAIAQLILERIITPDITEVNSMDELTSTERLGGFGSTGMIRVNASSDK